MLHDPGGKGLFYRRFCNNTRVIVPVSYTHLDVYKRQEAQCIDLTDENGFFRWLFNWLFGSKDKEEEPAPAY